MNLFLISKKECELYRRMWALIVNEEWSTPLIHRNVLQATLSRLMESVWQATNSNQIITTHRRKPSKIWPERKNTYFGYSSKPLDRMKPFEVRVHLFLCKLINWTKDLFENLPYYTLLVWASWFPMMKYFHFLQVSKLSELILEVWSWMLLSHTLILSLQSKLSKFSPKKFWKLPQVPLVFKIS